MQIVDFLMMWLTLLPFSQVMIDKFGFKESHSLMDGRLAICTIAVGFAMFALVWDYLRPFPESRPVLITCVLSYPFIDVH